MIVRCVKKKKEKRIKIKTTTISQADEYNKVKEGIVHRSTSNYS